jgi:predicted RNase H-like nuclease (RuvC/YqgF family)
MPDPREDLRATEESIRHDAEHVKSLEEEKEALDPTDPQIAHLSEQVERLTARLKDKAVAERELSHEVQTRK